MVKLCSVNSAMSYSQSSFVNNVINLLPNGDSVERSNQILNRNVTKWTMSLKVWCTPFIYTTTHCRHKAYCAILVRRPKFCHQASPRVSPRESTQRRKVELWARNVREFYLNADLHVTFRDLLLAVKLRHGTDGFTSPPKEGVLRIFFFALKNPTASAGCEPRELGYQRPALYL